MCIADVPMVLGKPRPLNGTYLCGWGTHDLVSKGSWPTALWAELRRKFGAPAMPSDGFGAQSGTTLMRLRDSMLRTIEQMQSVACELLRRDWDFACMVFGATHRVGHYLWDLSQINQSALTSSEHAVLSGTLLEVYQATDHAIARVLEHVGDETLVIAFSVHGMGPNPGWGDLAPDILDAAGAAVHGAAAGAQGRGLLYGLKRAVPFHWVRPIVSRLPSTATERLVSLWSAQMCDWKTTRRFPLPMDGAGYLRVNLRGREREGIVVEGSEYEAVCASLAELFQSLRDRDTGQQIAPTVLCAYADAPRDAPYRMLLPDLVVPWDGPSAISSREVICDSLPSFHYDVPARMPSGRSGNHTDDAWFIAAGPQVPAGTTVAGHSILDLAPTVMRSLGTEPLAEFQGKAIAFEQGVGSA
jgi:predicted AlkP superfamily phosphohydrolase/phosphomutase